MNPRAFDAYIRTLTAALLSLVLVGAALYSLLFQHTKDPDVTTWAALAVGFYLGGHFTQNGAASAKRATDDEQSGGGGS